MTQREDKERVKTARENLGKYFYDLSKTCFAVMVAGNAVTIITEQKFTHFNIQTILTGIFLTWGFAYLANYTLNKNNKDGSISNYIFYFKRLRSRLNSMVSFFKRKRMAQAFG